MCVCVCVHVRMYMCGGFCVSMCICTRVPACVWGWGEKKLKRCMSSNPKSDEDCIYSVMKIIFEAT